MKVSGWIACLALLAALPAMKLAQAQTAIDGGATVNQTSSSVPNPWNIADDFYIGDSGVGTLKITNSGSVVSNGNSTNIGNNVNSNGTVMVDGVGSNWIDNSSYFTVGFRGTGRLDITGGGNFSSVGYCTVGWNSGSDGTISVDGTGSIFTSDRDLYIGYGYAATGKLNITRSGSVVVNGAGYIGDIVESDGAVTVDGAGSVWTINKRFYIGLNGAGKLDITNGGNVISNYLADVGFYSGSNGTVTVDGAGSAWNMSNHLNVGTSGTGKLNITGGGSVSAYSSDIGPYGDGTVTVDGAGSIWSTGQMFFADTSPGSIGRLYITNGGSVLTDFSSFASRTGYAEIKIDGAGSNWTIAPSAQLSMANSRLDITNGGNFSTGGDVLYNMTGTSLSTGSMITVDGAGSTWTNTDNLLGHAGKLDIVGGGRVSNTNGYVGYYFNGAGSANYGMVKVDGAGSTWTNSGTLSVGRGSTIGGLTLSGAGKLYVTNGATVLSDAGYIGAGPHKDGSINDGTVTIDGAGSTWTVANDVIFVGLATGSYGKLYITGGGNVSNTNGRIGDSGGDGAVMVDGLGSTWTNSGFVVVGIGGTGALTVANGGSVSATSVPVGNAGGTGVVNIGAPQGQNAVAPGVLNTPTVTLGATSSLVFNHTGAHYTFTPQITGAGGVQIENGATILAGNNSYSGDTHTYGSGTLDLNGVNSSLASLINDGTVNMGATPGTKLTAASYSGNGTLRLNVAADGSAADALVITGTVAATTATKLSIALTGSGQLTTGNGILVVDASAATVGSGAKFLLSAPQTVDGVTYALVKVGKNWYLQGSPAAAGDATAVPVPTMGEGALALLVLMLAGLAVIRRRV